MFSPPGFVLSNFWLDFTKWIVADIQAFVNQFRRIFLRYIFMHSAQIRKTMGFTPNFSPGKLPNFRHNRTVFSFPFPRQNEETRGTEILNPKWENKKLSSLGSPKPGAGGNRQGRRGDGRGKGRVNSEEVAAVASL